MYNFSEFYIGGEWVEPAQPRSLAVTDPASEQQIGTISLGTAADVDRAVAAARAAFPAFAVSSRDERIDLLDRITDAYKKRYADIAAAISAEMGAPIALATNAQSAMGIAYSAEVCIRGRIGRHPDSSRAGWCMWPDNAVELADQSNRMQSCTGSGGRLHDGIEAERNCAARRCHSG